MLTRRRVALILSRGDGCPEGISSGRWLAAVKMVMRDAYAYANTNLSKKFSPVVTDEEALRRVYLNERGENGYER